MPPQVLARKVGGRLWRPIERSVSRRLDRWRVTSCVGTAVGASSSLHPYIHALPLDALRPHAEAYQRLAEHYTAHRFHLLGSGWREVGYGAECPGMGEFRYPAGPLVTADRAGEWLGEFLPGAFLPTARQVWQLVDADYQPIDWQLDFKSGYRWSPRAWSRDIRYGHLPGVDVKVPWELARMQHLPQLAGALAIARSGEPGFAESSAYSREFRNVVLDFAATNPPRFGVNWSCAMDVALRAVSWLVAYDLFRAVGMAFDGPFEEVFAQSLRDHGRHVFANFEWCPLVRGNHYLANIAGLLFIAAYLPCDHETDEWLVVAIDQFLKETWLQFRPDGSNFEGSTSYHRLSGEMVVFGTALMLGLCDQKLAVWRRGLNRRPRVGPSVSTGPNAAHRIDGRSTPCDEEHLRLVALIGEFSRAVAKHDGRVAQIGDNDSGRFLKLTPAFNAGTSDEEEHLDHGPLVAAIAGLLRAERPARYALEAHVAQELAGGAASLHKQPTANGRMSIRNPTGRTRGRDDSVIHVARRDAAHASRTLHREFAIRGGGGDLRQAVERRAFAEFGLYIYRSPRLFLAIRCGGCGQIATGGHEHCDQLAVELQIDGCDVIRDPGTHVYTPCPEERNRYRSAAAHFVPHFGQLDDLLYPEALEQGLFQLLDIRRGECALFEPTQFVGTRHVGEWTIRRTIEIESEQIVIHDECDGPLRLSNDGDPSDRSELWRTIRFSPGYGLLDGPAVDSARVLEVAAGSDHLLGAAAAARRTAHASAVR